MAAQYFYVALGVYWAVLVAELIGDKTIYTVASLALRFRPTTILTAIVIAYSLKMAVAVTLGSFLVVLRSPIVAFISAGAFFASALAITLRKPESASLPDVSGWGRGAMTCFTSLFMTEWGDPGQVVAAASAARFHPTMIVWLGGVLAMITKATLSLVVGHKLRDHLPQRALRVAAAISLSVLGIVTLTQIAVG
jgi:putative Ca2+/H+ antiporter (TMEM165/GDT1 family)